MNDLKELKVPAGKVVMHNYVNPTRDGFRAYLVDADAPGIEVCECSWAPELGKHFRSVRSARKQRPRPTPAEILRRRVQRMRAERTVASLGAAVKALQRVPVNGWSDASWDTFLHAFYALNRIFQRRKRM